MPILNSEGRLFGRFNVLDVVVTGAIALGVAGVFLVQSGTQVTSGQVVEGETDILVYVQIPSLKTLDRELFEPDKNTSITIRNQPRGEVLIESVKSAPTKVTMLGSNQKPLAVDDIAMANSYDYTVVLKDHAKITKDGFVTEGVKVKIGLPIELEGFNYRVYGKIVDVQAAQ